MVRSLYSGVSGMKAHQSKMDVIGNNISNVNTYGFKASRATFSDIFYQSTGSASAGTANSGGVNPSEIGYGANLGSVDVLHGTSTMATSSNALDVAITGEGFFQVQDSEGNTFYTRAGLLNIDSYGNLVDVNGNFVLGVSGSPIGQAAGSSRIQITIPSVDPSTSSYSESINGVNYTISSSNSTKDANLTMTFIEGNDLPIGQDVSAVITSSGITISVNPIAEFASLEDYNSAINSAITAAYGGTHPGGTFTVEMNPEEAWPADGLSGAEVLGKNFGINEGTIDIASALSTYGFDIEGVGTAFGASFSTDADASWTIQRLFADDATTEDEDEAIYSVQCVVGGVSYTGIATAEQLSTGTETLILKQGSYVLKDGATGNSYNDYVFTEAAAGYDANDTITISVPTAKKFEEFLAANGVTSTTGTGTSTAVTSSFDSVTASTPSDDLGLSGTPFILTGGTAGGIQGVEDLTGIAIGGDGIIYGNHAVHGLMELGRIDLVTFSNNMGLTQVGSTYFQLSANSGDPQVTCAGENGSGAIASATLEMSSVDLSGEMADMITTQRGFQACSRMITVSDTMLEELINLKR